MAAVSQSIPNLLGGVSQQPDPVKLPGQVREALNVYLDPTFGCKKRPPTKYVAPLDAPNTPAEVKWFPVFRDNQEKYLVAIYKDTVSNNMQLKVWDLISGTERTVTMGAGAQAYLATSNIDTLNHLSISDYTLISNSERDVSMSDVLTDVQDQEALVMINAVAYNTSYSIDINSDVNPTQTKIYRATKLSVTPGSEIEEDEGSCEHQSAEEHVIDDGAKTDLAFRLVVQCSAFLPPDADPDDDIPPEYKSRYTAAVSLRNGGVGWRVGDTVQVTQANKTYTITVDEEAFTQVYASDGTATFTTPVSQESGGLNVSDIVGGLATAVNALSNYTADTIGNVVRIKRDDDKEFNCSVRGGISNRAMTSIKGSVNDVSLLPTQCFDGYVLKVNNTEASDSDDYYVEFQADSSGIPGNGAWEETMAPGTKVGFNFSTMPYALVRQANGEFTFGPLDTQAALGGWAGREVGDETTNPEPTFVGHGISGMFFYQNRLGFLSGDNVILSQAGDYFNFFVSSALAISDADPVDMAAASTKPARLRAAFATAKGLLLFADNSQFLMSSPDIVFGPKTVTINEIADYKYDSRTKPVSTGISVTFVTESQTYSKVFEMAVASVDNRPQVAEISRAVPEYIPTNLLWNTSNPNSSLVAWGTGNDTAYVFKYFNTGNERQLAGWSKWVFPSDCKLMAFDSDTGYVVTKHPDDSYHLSVLELADDPDDSPVNTPAGKFTPRLDYYLTKDEVTISEVDFFTNRITFPNTSYSPESGTIFPVGQPGPTTFSVIATSGENESIFIEGEKGSTSIVVPKWITEGDFVMGVNYEMRVDLPSFYVQIEKRSDRVDYPMVEFLYLDLYLSGTYQVEVDKFGYDKITQYVGQEQADVYIANDAVLDEVRTETVPIFCLGRTAQVSIVAKDPMPAALTSYSWQGHYNKRGIRLI